MTSNNLERLRRGNDAKPFQSKLVPHADFIRQGRGHGWSYSRLAAELREQFGITVAPSSIHAFVKARSGRQIYALPEPLHAVVTPQKTDAIERLKRSTAAETSSTGGWHLYDSSQPLEKLSTYEKRNR